MDSEMKFYMDGSFSPKKEYNIEDLSENLKQIKELYALLSTDEKVLCKIIIREENIF